MTLGGTWAFELSDATDRTIPPEGACPFSVTVPVDERPPPTEVGLRVKLVGIASCTFKVVVTLALSAIAVIVAFIVLATGTVVTVKVAVVLPTGTVIDNGTLAAALFDSRPTCSPPVGAGTLSVNVATEDVPPPTLVGETVRLANTGGKIVKVAVKDPEPDVAVSTA